jgi:putative Mg2+ transporter-C (MgtC) family protein
MDVVTTPGQFADAVLRLLMAVALGAAVGFDRELHRKPAGLRTHALVSLGAALMTLTALLISDGDSNATSRVLQGVLAGIGFLGGGVILHRGETNSVYGLTTAASIWVTAALGVAIGSGLWRIAATGAVLTLLLLVLENPIDWLVGRISGRRGDSSSR